MKGQFIGLHGEKSKDVREARETRQLQSELTDGREQQKGQPRLPLPRLTRCEFDLRKTKKPDLVILTV